MTGRLSVFDIDGTLANNAPIAHLPRYTATTDVSALRPIKPVLAMLRSEDARGAHVLCVTGRGWAVHEATVEWVHQAVGWSVPVYTRPNLTTDVHAYKRAMVAMLAELGRPTVLAYYDDDLAMVDWVLGAQLAQHTEAVHCDGGTMTKVSHCAVLTGHDGPGW
jgi:hypothetical protein